MSDKIITKAIDKIHFTIVTFLLFIALTFTSLFILLQNGIYLKDISILNLHIEQLYIKWNEKLDLSIKELRVTPKAKSQVDIDIKELEEYIKSLRYTKNWFNSLIIEQIKIGDLNASLKYSSDSLGFLRVESPSLLLKSTLSHTGNMLIFDIEELLENERKIASKGSLYFDLKEHKAFANLDLLINSDANLTIYAAADKSGIDFSLKSHKEIEDIKYLIQIASLPSRLKYWTQDAIDVEGFELEALKGKIDFLNIQESLKNIYAKAQAKGLTYTYNTKLDGIRTRSTQLEFLDGVLYINPKEALTYGGSLGESWLKLDFTQKSEILTLYLLFDAKLDENMLKILNTYRIKIPFLQKSGSVKTALALGVNLASLDVDAQGSFYIEEANIDYLNLNIDVHNAEVSLDNNLVTTNAMRARYKDIAAADVKLFYDSRAAEGIIDFSFDSIAFGDIELLERLNATYKISPQKDLISLDKSTWSLSKERLSIDPIVTSFDIKKMLLDIPATLLNLQNITSGFVEGSIDIKNKKADLSLDVLNFSYKGVKSTQSSLPLKIHYDERLHISSSEKLYLLAGGISYIIEKPIVTIDEQEIRVKNTHFSLGEYLSAKLFAKYNIKEKKTHASLNDLLIKEKKEKNSLYFRKKILLSMEHDKEAIKINSNELEARAKITNDGWSIHFNSLNQIAENSKLLQSYGVGNGEFTLSKSSKKSHMDFNTTLLYPYEILIKEGTPTSNYKIQGEIEQGKISFSVNEKTQVSLSDTININTKDVGININEVLRLIKSVETDKKSKQKRLYFQAEDSFIYISENRKVLYDTLNLEQIDTTLTAQLKHKNANASLRVEDGTFHLYGKNFNDMFMQELFHISKFKDGSLDFSISGTKSEYSGVAYIKESTIMDYKILNNILAFINTVPSLVTFSLPGYSRSGIRTKDAYVKFNAKDSLFHITDIYLESKELSILGQGTLDLDEDTIDIDLNLKTDLGSNISKVPLVGHLLFDDESVSTTLKIVGKLSDPQVKSLIARDIAVAPLNIIKRTLTLPFTILKEIGNSKGREE